MNRDIEKILNLKFYSGEDLYSDGDVEDEILEICQKNAADIKSVLKASNDWSLLYHLSDIRHNILEWYDFDKNGSILEIGSGCGAITGLFCEKLNRVVGIDLSKRRSTINAVRNGEKGNLEIMVGNFEDIVIEEKFDYVTLIGVLEYSPLYINGGKNPFDVMLQKLKGYLKPNGKLIIAIENKFGLKYFAGAAEDHTGRFFDGVNNYKGINHVYTFSKPEITKLLKNNGFKDNMFYYPLPDYKLPTAVYSEDNLPKPGSFLNVGLSYDRDRVNFLEETAIYDKLSEDGQFEYFANSFLIVSSLSEEV